MRGLGTVVNVVAVIVGSGIGLVIKGGLKERFQSILMQVLGLAVMFIGASQAIELYSDRTMILIVSLVVGALIGELIRIETRLDHMGEWLKSKVKSRDNGHFVEGFVTSSLVICVGAMAVVGSLQDGITGNASTLYAKAALDFVIVLIFASTLGIGVMFSALPLLIYQGGITIISKFIEPYLSTVRIENLSFVGAVLIFAVGVNLAFGKKFRVGNMLPALLIALFF